ncbi:MAG: multidrug efflux SMR transporter [Bacteroidia bacterium]|nr:multidrug efflux SMR transporter [Bacteroidia bacterium]MCZ2247929.1 multidrug efflux SMR transporter [Bacteroidia bacterium]
MNWIILILAGFCEVAFTFCLEKAKHHNGMTMYMWYAGFAIALSLSMYLLIKAIETIPISTAYTVWTGIGAVGTVLISIFFFKEPTSFIQLFFLTILIGAIIGLRIVSH